MTLVNRIARSLGANAALKGSVSILAIRLCSALAGILMFALLSRSMDHAAFGTLVIIFNAMSFLAVLALCGQETLIVRSWPEYCQIGRPGLARGALIFGARVSLIAGLVTAVVAAFVWLTWNRNVSPSLVLGACAFLFAQSLMHFSGQFSRVAGGLIISDVPRELMWRLVVVIAICICHFIQIGFGATEFFLVASGALLFAIGFQAWHVTRELPKAVTLAVSQSDTMAWIARSFKMWLSALTDATGQFLEVLLVGLVLGPAAAGSYFVITRITNVFAMISGSIAVYATTQISMLFHSGAQSELQRILRTLAAISTIIVGATFLFILATGSLLLSPFGPVYVESYYPLIMLAAGASILALAGPSPHLLLLTGHEGAYPRIMATGLILRFALIAILGPQFGLMGAAIAWSISAIFIAFALVIASWRLIGLDPSSVSIFSRTGGPVVPFTRHSP